MYRGYSEKVTVIFFVTIVTFTIFAVHYILFIGEWNLLVLLPCGVLMHPLPMIGVMQRGGRTFFISCQLYSFQMHYKMNEPITAPTALGWLDVLFHSQDEYERLNSYDRLRELITLLLPET